VTGHRFRKSTTLASLIDIINRTKPLHIVTVEDRSSSSMTQAIDHHQREIGEDTKSFSEALRRVLRQDRRDLVGELRDLEPSRWH